MDALNNSNLINNNYIDNDPQSNIQIIEYEKVSKLRKIYFLMREMINKVKNFISSFIFPLSESERLNKLEAEYIELKKIMPLNIEHWKNIIVTHKWENGPEDAKGNRAVWYLGDRGNTEMSHRVIVEFAKKYDNQLKIYFDHILCIDFKSFNKIAHITSIDAPFHRCAKEKKFKNNEKALVIIHYGPDVYRKKSMNVPGFEKSKLNGKDGVFYPAGNTTITHFFTDTNKACFYITSNNEGYKLRTRGELSNKLLNIIFKGTAQ